MTQEEVEVPSKYTPEQIEQIWADYMIEGARYGDKNDVEEALARNTDVNATDAKGRTALHVASANGYVDIMSLLLAAGANTETCNFKRNTALHWACIGGHLDAITLLLRHGASPSALNEAEQTPLDGALDNEAILKVFQNYSSVPETRHKCFESDKKATSTDHGVEKPSDRASCVGKDVAGTCEPRNDLGAEDNISIENVCNGVKDTHL
jgi:hypothetical protein